MGPRNQSKGSATWADIGTSIPLKSQANVRQIYKRAEGSSAGSPISQILQRTLFLALPLTDLESHSDFEYNAD